MKTSSSTYLIWGAILVVIGLIAFAVVQSTEQANGKYDTFAQCLTDQGTKMYGAYWCPHCENQKEDFGSSFEYVDYIECWNRATNSQTPECQEAGIEGYPTWEFADGSRQSGELDFEELAEASGCEFVEDEVVL